MKKNDPIKRLERILQRIFLVLAVIAVAGIILMIKYSGSDGEIPPAEPETAEEYDWSAGLSDNTLWLPDNCGLYERIPEFNIYDENKEVRSISDFRGKSVIVTFWASWCSDCWEQMPYMNRYQQAVEEYQDITFLFINKTDGSRETMQSAKDYLADKQLQGEFYYDIGLEAYNTLGLHNIPTTIFLDSDGIIKAWSPKPITETGVFEALTRNMMEGSGTVTAGFIQDYMMDPEGGIHSLYDENQEVVYRSDVLSESQGAMLEYAVVREDKDLFDKIFSYISGHMLDHGLISWTVTDGQASYVNALIDDLRIYAAIEEADKLWGGYEDILAGYGENLLQYGIREGNYIDFYDAQYKQYADRFTLCYADLKTMKRLGEKNDTFEQAYLKAVQIVADGQISESFPLYYSWYDYDKKKYEDTELNMAEAMVTLLHLAEANKLPDNSIQWLKARMKADGIKARYTVKGKVVKGYNYDSTAVYALVVMIANEIGDEDLKRQAFKKMEKMHITDTGFSYNGSFGQEDGTGITSFDQIMPLLAYEYAEKKGN